MLNSWRALKKYFTLVLCGISAITLMPSSDYSQFITPPEQMLRKNWQRTGELLRKAIEKSCYHERQRNSKC